MSRSPLPWKSHPARAELLALYAEVDALLAPHGCAASADCCHFGRTGREPYVQAPELAELVLAARAKNVPLPDKRKLRLLGPAPEGRCPMLDAGGRCRVYAERPLGCRTYFCERRTGPGKLPRERIGDVVRRLAALSARAFPRDPGPRALRRALVGEPPDMR